MNHPHEPASPDRCARPHAQQMRIRLARARLQEVRQSDLGVAEPAALLFTVDRLAHAVEDLLALIDEGCSDDPS